MGKNTSIPANRPPSPRISPKWVKPYCKPAKIVRSDGSVRQIQTLRDTGAMQSLLKDTHNSNDYITTDETRLLKGITTNTLTVPLVQVHLHTDFIDETVLCGLVNDLPAVSRPLLSKRLVIVTIVVAVVRFAVIATSVCRSTAGICAACS